MWSSVTGHSLAGTLSKSHIRKAVRKDPQPKGSEKASRARKVVDNIRRAPLGQGMEGRANQRLQGEATPAEQAAHSNPLPLQMSGAHSVIMGAPAPLCSLGTKVTLFLVDQRTKAASTIRSSSSQECQQEGPLQRAALLIYHIFIKYFSPSKCN